MTVSEEKTARLDAVRLGDVLRISVELIRQIYEMPDHSSEHVRLKEIRREDDGCLVLVVDSVDPYQFNTESQVVP